MKVQIALDGHTHEVHLRQTDRGWEADVDGHTVALRQDRRGPGTVVTAGDRSFVVHIADDEHVVVDGLVLPFRLGRLEGAGARAGHLVGPASVHPPMNGKLEKVLVAPGDTVEEGQVLFVLEAMKMHNEVRSPAAGIVDSVGASAGDVVDPTMVIVGLRPEPSEGKGD